MSFKSVYSPEQIISRARTWIGKSSCRVLWGNKLSCIHLIAYAYGWEKEIPLNWKFLNISDFTNIVGWTFVKEQPFPSALCVFYIHGKEHLGIYTEKEMLIHAGSISFVETSINRFYKYYKGVLLCP